MQCVGFSGASPTPLNCSVFTQQQQQQQLVGYSTSSVTLHRRLLNIVGDSTSSTLSTIEKETN
jgi:hypothetical protein